MDLPETVVAALLQGKKIEAIRLLCGEREIGLKEAKELVEAFQFRRQTDDLQSGMVLPETVIQALTQGKKIEAIRLLRSERGIGLKEAKEMVETFQPRGQSGVPLGREAERTRGGLVKGILIALTVAAFVWTMVNSVDVAGSLIVLFKQEGYVRTIFTVEEVFYQDGRAEEGLKWGLEGRLPDREARLYAPWLADAKYLKRRGLDRMFPPGTTMDVWFNPQVTDVLFQNRTLRVIPYTPDLAVTETRRITGWVENCILPLVLILGIDVLWSRRNRAIPFAH